MAYDVSRNQVCSSMSLSLGQEARILPPLCAMHPSPPTLSSVLGMVMAGPGVWRQRQEGGGARNALSLPSIVFVKSKTGVQAVLQRTGSTA